MIAVPDLAGKLARVPDAFRPALVAATDAWTHHLGDRLFSLVFLGSVARGTADASSDIDLTVIADGFPKILRDRFFESVLAGMRARMRELGSRRVFLSDGSWYCDLKPDFRSGEVVEI